MKPTNRIFLQGITKLEKKHTPAILKAIKAFRNRFIADLEARGMDYATSRLQLPQANPELSKIIQDIYKDAGLFGAKLTASELKAMLNQKDMSLIRRIKAGAFGRNEGWIRAVQQYLKLHLVRLVQKITDTMREDIVRILQRAVSEGININDTVKELRKEELMEARARLISRTEVVRAANVGHSVGAQETPYEVDKGWSAARDHRTRHGHREVNGKVVGETETFRVNIYDKDRKKIGHDDMLYPGDATASAANVCNCRCRATYTPRRDSAGRLIMREQPGAQVIPIRRAPSQTPGEIAAQAKGFVISVD